LDRDFAFGENFLGEGVFTNILGEKIAHNPWVSKLEKFPRVGILREKRGISSGGKFIHPERRFCF